MKTVRGQGYPIPATRSGHTLAIRGDPGRGHLTSPEAGTFPPRPPPLHTRGRSRSPLAAPQLGGGALRPAQERSLRAPLACREASVQRGPNLYYSRTQNPRPGCQPRLPPLPPPGKRSPRSARPPGPHPHPTRGLPRVSRAPKKWGMAEGGGGERPAGGPTPWDSPGGGPRGSEFRRWLQGPRN